MHDVPVPFDMGAIPPNDVPQDKGLPHRSMSACDDPEERVV